MERQNQPELFFQKEPVLVSLCWTGAPVRYHGRPVASPGKIKTIQRDFLPVFVCPEMLGGLSTPRPAAPLRNKSGDRIFDVTGKEVSAEFLAGAAATLEIAKRLNIKVAYLCAKSPSCDIIGFAGELLIENGIKVINL